MTPEQVEILQLSLAQLGQRAPELAQRFYSHLFESVPSCRSMFSEDTADQEAIFMSELAIIVASISEFEAFVSRTERLGARHAGYGVTCEHYQVAGSALLEALAETLGPGCTAELQDAWRLAFDLVAETMMQGAADLSPDRRGA